MHFYLQQALPIFVSLFNFKCKIMKQGVSYRKLTNLFRTGIICLVLAGISQALFSFTVRRMADDFLKQLGITAVTADQKISGSMLEGSFDTYGIKRTSAIPPAIRSAVASEALAYSKKYVNSAAFIKKYEEMRLQRKPEFKPLKTPDEMMQENIQQYRKSVQDAEASVKKADATMKPVFENVLAEVKKQQLDAENPNSKQYVNYRKNYEAAEKNNRQGYERLLAEWEQKYPSNHLLYIRQRLEQFMQETADVDFTAETVMKNGKKIFVNPQYERKGNRWKMAYRAGKDVVETARNFVQQWMSEIR